MSEIKNLKYFAGGQWLDTTSGSYMDIYDPSTGEVQARAPRCTKDKVSYAIECAKKAFGT